VRGAAGGGGGGLARGRAAGGGGGGGRAGPRARTLTAPKKAKRRLRSPAMSSMSLRNMVVSSRSPLAPSSSRSAASAASATSTSLSRVSEEEWMSTPPWRPSPSPSCRGASRRMLPMALPRSRRAVRCIRESAPEGPVCCPLSLGIRAGNRVPRSCGRGAGPPFALHTAGSPKCLGRGCLGSPHARASGENEGGEARVSARGARCRSRRVRDRDHLASTQGPLSPSKTGRSGPGGGRRSRDGCVPP